MVRNIFSQYSLSDLWCNHVLYLNVVIFKAVYLGLQNRFFFLEFDIWTKVTSFRSERFKFKETFDNKFEYIYKNAVKFKRRKIDKGSGKVSRRSPTEHCLFFR